MKRGSGILSKTGGVLIALLFCVGFGAGGAYGVASLASQMKGWWQARSWVAVPATVLAVELQERYDDGTTYRVAARYAYDYGGHHYEGARVGFNTGYDNVGSWQRDHYRELESARRAGRPITIWVDPEQPQRSVVDRRLRGSMLAFMLPFATLFPAVSIGAFLFLIGILRKPAAAFNAPPALAPNAPQIKSDALKGTTLMWGFAIVWGMISFPLAFAFVPELFGKSLAWVFVMLFPLVGVVLLVTAARLTLRVMRHGEVTLAIEPLQPRLGETLQVRVSFDREPTPGEYAMALLCEKVDTRGDSTTEKNVWRQDRAVQVSGATALAAFAPLAQLPSSEPHGDVYHRWRVLLTFPDGKDKRAFDVVIAAAR